MSSPLRSVATTSILALSGGVLATGCAFPHGSFARPVKPAADGAVMLSAGAMVPVVAAGSYSDDGDSASGAALSREFAFIPAGAFDWAFGEGSTFGLEVSVFTPLTFVEAESGSDFLGIFVNPRFELNLMSDKASRSLTLTIDGNLGFLRTRSPGSSEDISTPYFSPTVGIRTYLPTGFGGFVLSQQFGTAAITFILPGSLAYDIPIPLGGSTLHLFPEFRWDPTFFIGIGDEAGASGVLFLGSAGLSVMLEL